MTRMLYMFSGPDFLYATSFFPSASTYVLAGLEPVGDVPPLTEPAARQRRRIAAKSRELARFAAQLQLLHHQEYEDAVARRAGLRNAADALCVPGADRQDHPGRQLRQPRRGRKRADASRPATSAAPERLRAAKRRQRRQDRLFRRRSAPTRRFITSAPTSPTAA